MHVQESISLSPKEFISHVQALKGALKGVAEVVLPRCPNLKRMEVKGLNFDVLPRTSSGLLVGQYLCWRKILFLHVRGEVIGNAAWKA